MKNTISVVKIESFFLISIIMAAAFMGSGCAKSQKTQAENNYNQSAFATGIKEEKKSSTAQSKLNNKDEKRITEAATAPYLQKSTVSGPAQDVALEDAQNNSTKEEKKEPYEIHGLVLVRDIVPDVEIELKYATEDNFTKTQVYPHDICALQKSTAIKLKKANTELMEIGYRLKIWDAYRPLSVQKIFWNLVSDSKYVANPSTGGSKHNRGTAVDVTLVDMNGNELEMPTEFDDFTGKAARSNKDISIAAKKNVELLTNVMIKNGFTTISTEWWHYNDSDSGNYNALDVDLEEFMQGDAPSNSQGLKIDQYIDKLNNVEGVTGTGQILLMLADDIEISHATVYAYEKFNGQWRMVFEPIKSVIAANGMAYDKKEGDKKSPIGIFPLYRCFGRDENPGTRLIYTKFGKNDFWVDDANSAFYNTYQKGLPNGRWASAEDLYGIGDAYRFFVVIEYNTENPVPGKGSAIFMHIWKGEESHTSGCTAMGEENLIKIIKWLDPKKSPFLLQYQANDF